VTTENVKKCLRLGTILMVKISIDSHVVKTL